LPQAVVCISLIALAFSQTGEAAPVERKGLCVNHQAAIAKFFPVRTLRLLLFVRPAKDTKQAHH
jgi:hypothetical protein